MIAALIASAVLSLVSNSVDRLTAERSDRIAAGEALKKYTNAVAEIEGMRLRANGDGSLREIEDLENRLPRLKGMAEIEKKAARENQKMRRDAAFCDAYAPILLLSPEEIRTFVRYVSVKDKTDLEKIDAALFKKTSSASFIDSLAVEMSRFGCGYTQYVFTYTTRKSLVNLRRHLVSILSAL